MVRLILALVCSIWIAACTGSMVQSTIETHHRLSAAHLTEPIVVLPAREERARTLEFETYAGFVEEALRREGFEIVSVGQPAELVAIFDYGIDQGRDEMYSYAIPHFGQTGIQSSQTFGTIQNYGYGATYSGTTTHTPSFGITGWTPQLGTRRVFKRAVALQIYDVSAGDEPVHIYQSVAVSEGESGALGGVVDEMIAAIFDDFRATGFRSVSVPMTDGQLADRSTQRKNLEPAAGTAAHEGAADHAGAEPERASGLRKAGEPRITAIPR